MASHPRGRFCPSLAPSHRPMEAKGRREGRAPAGTRDPCALEMHTGWITGDAGRPAFPARMVLTVSFVLSSGSDALLPPSSCGWLMYAPGRAATSPQGLTHRLRASGPHDFSVRGRFRLSTGGWRVLTPATDEPAVTAPCRAASREDSRCPPCHHADRAGATASTATRPASRDDREAPLWQGRDERVYATNPKFGKVECFCAAGLTGCFGVLPDGSPGLLDLRGSFRGAREREPGIHRASEHAAR